MAAVAPLVLNFATCLQQLAQMLIPIAIRDREDKESFIHVRSTPKIREIEKEKPLRSPCPLRLTQKLKAQNSKLKTQNPKHKTSEQKKAASLPKRPK
ncbi:MAG: hypothetical protein ACTHOF_14560 [Flavisolibacter sp.]